MKTNDTMASKTRPAEVFLATMHSGGVHAHKDTGLQVALSTDGVTFHNIRGNDESPIYAPKNGMRDPIVLFRQDNWYLAYTYGPSIAPLVFVAKSPDLLRWTPVCSLRLGADTANNNYVDVPQWIVDPAGNVHLIACMDFDHHWVEIHPLSNDPATWGAQTNWSAVTTLTDQNGRPLISGNSFVALQNGTYYMAFNGIDATVYYMRTSASLTSEWSAPRQLNIDRSVNKGDSLNLVFLANGTLRYYISNGNSLKKVIWYVESANMGVTWTSPKVVNFTGFDREGVNWAQVVRITDPAAITAMVAARQVPTEGKAAVTVLALSNGSVIGGETNMDTLSTASMLQPHGEAEVIIESRFGKAIINNRNPKMTALWLRNPDGSLPSESILSRLENASIPRRREGQGGSDSIAFVNGAYTYVVDPRGKRYESCLSRSHKVDVVKDSSSQVVSVKITGIELIASDDPDAPVIEDWEIATHEHGAELTWKITQHWRRDFSSVLSGTPALFLAPFGGWYYGSPMGRIAGKKNNVTSTIWYDPAKINAEKFGPPYLTDIAPLLVTDAVCQTLNVRDTWAIYKFFTNFHPKSDLRAQVAGGYLFRRGGSWGAFNEIGSSIADKIGFSKHAGDSERVTLTLGPVDKFDTGYQLELDIPDKAMNASLKDIYGSMMNGGIIVDQKKYFPGNQSEGCSHEYEPWIAGFPFSVGTPASGKLSACPYDWARAQRGLLQAILDTVGDDSRPSFGYSKYYNDVTRRTLPKDQQEGTFIDGGLNVIIGSGIYYLHTGDAAFVEKHLPTFERLLKRFIDDIDPKTGLFLDPKPGSHWYYDGVIFSGYNTYHNTLFYKSLTELAGMEKLLGNQEKAASYAARAEALKAAINKFLWTEDAPGGPRYADWVDVKGKRFTYFIDLVQYPAIVFGVASNEQAKKIIATADARIAELTTQYGYPGHATISSLWDNGCCGMPYGWYMNGGTLLVMTYFEVVARAMAGDHEGAYNRLKVFCRKYDQMSWVGNNAASIQGEMNDGDGDHEPYLSDFVTVTASAVNGILGINPTWDKLDVTPHLPKGWRAAKASILYKGVKHEVTVNGEDVTIKPMGRVYGKGKDGK